MAKNFDALFSALSYGAGSPQRAIYDVAPALHLSSTERMRAGISKGFQMGTSMLDPTKNIRGGPADWDVNSFLAYKKKGQQADDSAMGNLFPSWF